MVIMEHERPFLFSGPLVLALLDGRKTVTRRLLAGSEDIVDQPGDVWEQCIGCGGVGFGRKTDRGRWLLVRGGKVVFASRPTHMPGDGMWVRETWRVDRSWDKTKPSEIPDLAANRSDHVWYEATKEPVRNEIDPGRIRQSIFMPRWASRITRKVTRVVVERLQDITEEQARAEGVETLEGDAACWLRASSRGAFATLWDRINGKVPAKRWATNPLVVATTFEGP